MSAGTELLATMAALEQAAVRVRARSDLAAVQITLVAPGQEAVELLFGIRHATRLADQIQEAAARAGRGAP